MTSTNTGSDGRPGNVSDLLLEAATGFPDRPAVIWADGRRTWAQLDHAVDAGARALRGAGLQPGDRVIVSMETGADIIAALFAVIRAGLVAVPIGPARIDLAEIVGKVGARGAVAGQPGIPVKIVISPEEASRWWSPDQPTELGAPSAAFPTDIEDIAMLARAASSDRPVMVSHRAVLAAVAAIVAAPSLRLRAEDRAILVLPTYHLAGWITAFLPLCAVGGAAVIPDPPTAEVSWVDAVLATIRTQRVTVVPGAPSLYRRLRTASGVERAMASVRLMTSGAAPLDPGDSSAIRALTGQSVWEGYGISESSSVVATGLMTSAARIGSVGLPVPGVVIRIVGDDDADLYGEPESEDLLRPDQASDDLAADAGAGGEVGRIQIGGPTLFSGYWPDGGGGAEDDGWFATGDLGYFDDIGELHLVDRAAETIRVAGFTVYPREIEDVLMRHPYVRDAAVIGVPGKAGEAVAALLVPWRGTRPTPADLDEYVAAILPLFKRPQTYQLVDRLPRNEIGRIDRDEVRALYRRRALMDDGALPPVEETIPVTTGEVVPTDTDPVGPVGADVPAPVNPDVTPEAAAPLTELGTRLPGTGERDRRGDDDTDDDLF